MPFQINHISFELFGDHQFVRNLARKSRLPGPIEHLRGGILAHDLNRIGRCDQSGVWESFEKSANAKPMVSMAMCDVNGCQVFPFGCDPICQSVGLLDRHKGIHEDSVPDPIDEG